jgi:hypothetical protein
VGTAYMTRAATFTGNYNFSDLKFYNNRFYLPNSTFTEVLHKELGSEVLPTDVECVETHDSTGATQNYQRAVLSGRSGGQTLNGGTAASENLTLKSTSHATKGKIIFGTSAYDEANNRLGIGTTSPSQALQNEGVSWLKGTVLVGATDPASNYGVLNVDGNFRFVGNDRLIYGRNTTESYIKIYDSSNGDTTFQGTFATGKINFNTAGSTTPKLVIQANGDLSPIDGANIILGTSTGLKLGTATTQKLGFYNSTPIVQSGATTDLGTVLSNLGLRAAGTAYPITTSGAVILTGAVAMNATTLATDTTTGLKIGTATSQKLAFFNSTPIVQPTGNALTALTNLGLVASPTLAQSDITSLVSDLALKASLASPTFTGTVIAPIVAGSASSGGTLTLSTTTHATKGKILFGTSAYDEVNNRLGLGITTPTYGLHNAGTTLLVGTTVVGTDPSTDYSALTVGGDIRLAGNDKRIYGRATSESYIKIYDSSTGDMTFQGTWATGKINFNTAGSTTPKLILQANGDLTHIDGANIAVGTGTGTKIGTATTQKLAFYNSTPVVQPNTTGTTTGFTAGAGSAVDSAATFTGNTGSTAYTIGDIVKALKTLGLLAA